MDLLAEALRAYEAELASRVDSDYEVDNSQMQKLTEAFEFFRDEGCEVDNVIIRPRELHGGVTVHFSVLYLNGERLMRLAQVISHMSALSIDATLDGEVCFSFNIPNVFRKK